MKLKYLGELAGIAVVIDVDKNIADKTIVSLTDQALLLIDRMKGSGIDVGSLRENFTGIQLMCGNRVVLPELIDMAHEEIARLLGRSAWHVYGHDEFVEQEVCEQVAA